MELLGAAYAVHPAFGEAEVVEIGVDARPAFPDNLPRTWREGDTVFVNGPYRHGVLLTPAMYERAADLTRGKTTPFEVNDVHLDDRQDSSCIPVTPLRRAGGVQQPLPTGIDVRSS